MTFLGVTAGQLEKWDPHHLSFFIGGPYAQAADVFMFLTHYVQSITIHPAGGGSSISLPPDSLKPIGFKSENFMIPFPSQVFSGFRLFQEYFILPEKFLFLEARQFRIP